MATSNGEAEVPLGAKVGSGWWPNRRFIHTEYLLDDDRQARVSMLRHQSMPFVALAESDDIDELQRVADDYLKLVGPLLWRNQGDPAKGGLFGWLSGAGLPPDSEELPHLLGSFWVERQFRDKADRTLVLLKGCRLVLDRTTGEQLALGGSIGLRVVMHVAPADGGFVARTTGVSVSRLQDVARSAVHPLIAGRSPEQFRMFLRFAVQRVAQSAGLMQPRLAGVALTVNGARINGTGIRSEAGRPRVVAWSGRWFSAGDPPTTHVEVDHVREQIAMAAQQQVFLRDPASQGDAATLQERAPTRPEDTLRRYAKARPFPEDDLQIPDLLEVTPTPSARPAPGPGGGPVEPAPLESAPFRSDKSAAVHAFLRCTELMDRLRSYGLSPLQLFRQARLPLRLQHRAVLPDSPDSDSVNAFVRTLEPGVDLTGAYDPSQRPQLEVGFGAAELAHRHATRDAQGYPGSAGYLGLAADPRWAWHEFGHVMAFASTGQLEFPFAHSAGDALAAIVAAPDSELGPDAKRAGLTFPWVQIGRRHDRDVDLGWCWCGRLNRLRLANSTQPPVLYGSYAEEQLLSSSLFRSYQALGGATSGQDVDAVALRRRASDYLVYLMLRGIAMLGPWQGVPVRSADQFLSALIDADVGTHDWVIHAPWPDPDAPREVRRQGGSAHKALRWAFEQQGLFATEDPRELIEGQGRPPGVDLFIRGIGARADGGYYPVGLRWSDAGWKAAAEALRRNPDTGEIEIEIQNRGRRRSRAGSLRLWLALDDGSPLVWKGLGQQALPRVGACGLVTVTVPPPAGVPGGSAAWVLVEVSCPDDRANTDVSSGLPSATGWPTQDLVDLVDRVAGDNNLGLGRLQFD